ncbi:general substrate transporter [Auriculariales sp. MPI-PUGE-AT-0066]|nr:general substrate transporter [Auriculariales sp. MPI-PUGE-AT-0066]
MSPATKFHVTPFTIMMALMASMGGFLFGYDTGQISDILIMDDFLERFAQCTGTGSPSQVCKFSNAIVGLIVGLLSIGTAFGALFTAPIADRIGRTRTMSIQCFVFSIGVIIQITSFSAWYQIAIGRFVVGIGIGGLSALVPVYQAETAPKHIRGTLTATYQWFITLGILVAYLFCLATRPTHNSAAWRIPIALGLIFATFLGVGILFMPESPRFLLRHDREDEARRSLARVYPSVGDGENTVDGELREMKEGVIWERQQPKATWSDLFRPHNKTLYRTLLGIALQSVQQLTGVNVFFYYGATIFQSVGIKDSYITQIILGAINFGTTFFGLIVLEKFGRRVPLIVGALWQSFWLFVFSSVAVARPPTEQNSSGYIMIVSAALFILGFATTWGPGIWICMGEMFPTRTRAKQAGLATAANWIWNFLIAFFTPFIISDISFAYGYIFAGCNFAAALLVAFFLYESRGLSLEAVDRMYNDPNIKPWTSRRLARHADFERAADEDARLKSTNEKKSHDAPREQWREHGTASGTEHSTSPERV